MIRRLLLLNGLATIGAVLHHAAGWELTAMIWWTDRYLPVSVPDMSQIWSLRYLVLRVVDQFAVTGVFIFLMVSGYFVASAGGSRQGAVSWKIVLQRTKTVAIPYLLWSLVYFGYAAAGGITHSPGEYFLRLLTGGATGPFYYVPLLVQLYLIAPIVVPLARRSPRAVLATAIALQLPATAAKLLLLSKVRIPGTGGLIRALAGWDPPAYFLWFALGIVLALYAGSAKELLARLKIPLLVALTPLLLASIVEWEYVRRASGKEWISIQVTVLGGAFSLALILLMLGSQRLAVPAAEWIGKLGTKSYGVYLVHVLVLELTARGVYHGAPWLLGQGLLFLPLLGVAGIGVPLVLMRGFDRVPGVRTCYRYIFG